MIIPDVATKDGLAERIPLLVASTNFLRSHWLRCTAISAIVLAPCFWHRRIAAGDLGSHLYNAWLVELIRTGRAPGLSVANQSNNILFDFILSGLANAAGYAAAEKFAVASAVLVFVWGAFALVCAASGRTPWFLVPAIAMVAYGWTFHSGFFNYYLAVGLSFWGLAIAWRGCTREMVLVVPFVILTYVAHPLAVAWLGGAIAYLAIARAVPPRTQLLLLLLAGVMLGGIRIYAWYHRYYMVKQYFPAALINGADQLVLGSKYYPIAVGLAVLAAGSLVADATRRRAAGGFLSRHGLPLQLYIITLFFVWTQPTLIYLPTNNAAPLSFILERISLISATLACCVLGAIEPRRWHTIALTLACIGFFSLLYTDTARLNELEARVEELVHSTPRDQRVLATFQFQEDGSRLQFNSHMVDRACIGHCFSYANYEAATGQFRVRALGGNRIVMTSSLDIGASIAGTYVVRPEDMPIFQIYQRSADPADLAIRPLVAGEANGRLGFGGDRAISSTPRD